MGSKAKIGWAEKLSLFLEGPARFLENRLLLLLIGAIFTYGIGSFLTRAYQEADARGAFSKRYVDIAWARLHWARSVQSRMSLCLTSEEQDWSWEKYQEAVAAWNTELMSNLALLERYYDKAVRSQLEGDIQSGFGDVHKRLVALRYPKRDEEKTLCPDNGALSELEQRLDRLNPLLYQFAQDLDVRFAR